MEENLNEMLFSEFMLFSTILEKDYPGVKVRGESKKHKWKLVGFWLNAWILTMEDEPD